LRRGIALGCERIGDRKESDMQKHKRASEAAMLRLSRYHCFLGEIGGERPDRRITSREIADALGLTEETVRHDVKHVGIDGRPGAGYAMEELRLALQEYLGLGPSHPFIAVGNADILRGLAVTFPSGDFGLRPVAYFSDRPQDAGTNVGEIEIQSLDSLVSGRAIVDSSLALVACAPEAVNATLAALHGVGITGVLMLTPVLRPEYPEGMSVTYFRMPCALKALASRLPPADGTPVPTACEQPDACTQESSECASTCCGQHDAD
jgi:NADH/NAD ratio-sensing transcriptional regulator Rex